MAQQKKPEDEAVDQVIGFLTSTKGLIIVGVLALGLVASIVWSMFS